MGVHLYTTCTHMHVYVMYMYMLISDGINRVWPV